LQGLHWVAKEWVVGMLFFITGMITVGYHGNHQKSITSDYNTDRASNQWLLVIER